MTARILILEDDTVLGPLLRHSLETHGYRVSLHENSTTAISYMEANPVDLVVADLFVTKDGALTRDGGVRLISTIKQLWNRPTPIIAISGSFSSENRHETRTTALTVGADALLGKPFSPRALLDLIGDLLSR